LVIYIETKSAPATPTNKKNSTAGDAGSEKVKVQDANLRKENRAI